MVKTDVATLAELHKRSDYVPLTNAVISWKGTMIDPSGNNWGQKTTISTPPVTATPVVPVAAPVAPAPVAAVPSVIKSAPLDTVEFVDESFSKELMIDLLFEDVGGQELLTIARHDTVNGQDVAYQPIKNLGILQEIYNPTNLLMLQETSDKYFANFMINLRDKIPKVGSGANGANYYLDMSTGDGVIELINLKSDEQVEVQIASAGIMEDVGI